MNYVAYTVVPKISEDISAEEASDILLAELQELSFESFEQTENNLVGYIKQRDDSRELHLLLMKHPLITDVSRKVIPARNWNEVWESSFEPVEIWKKVRIRALFHHSDASFVHEVVIQPKMSFGTGHHATTRLILEELSEHPPIGFRVLDMGCGTSVLGIYAEKLGAGSVDAVDNDLQCVENSIENIEWNDCCNISVHLLDKFKPVDQYDLIIANIQRNVLIEQMPLYARLSKPGSRLWLSGIMEHDKEAIMKCAIENNFRFIKDKIQSPWVLLIAEKLD